MRCAQKNIVKMQKVDIDDPVENLDNSSNTNDQNLCKSTSESNDAITTRVEWNVSITRPSFSIPDSNTALHYKNIYESLIKPNPIVSKPKSPNDTMNALLSPRMNFRSMKSLTTRQRSFASTIEDEEGLVQINQYRILNDLGGGSYGVVKLVQDNDGHLSALKIISKKKLMRSTGYFRRPPPIRKNSTSTGSFCDDSIRGSVSQTCSPSRSIKAPIKSETKSLPKSFSPSSNLWISSSMNDSLRNDPYLDPLRRVYQEIAIYKKLDHPNIVKLYEVIDEPDQENLFMIFEHVEGGPVMNVGVSDPLSEDLARTYFRDILCGLEYLHFNKIIHRDIKPSNLLVDKNGVVKMIDFGVSCQFTGDDIFLQDTVGSPAFLAPECVQECHGRFKGKALDIWALGMTLHCFLFGKVVFGSRNKIDLYHSIATKSIVLPNKPELSSEALDILTKMLNKNPMDRVKLENIKIHPWVTNNGKLTFSNTNQNNNRQIEVSEHEVEQCTVKPVHIQAIVSALMMARRRSFKNPNRYLDSSFKLRELILHSEIEKRKLLAHVKTPSISAYLLGDQDIPSKTADFHFNRDDAKNSEIALETFQNANSVDFHNLTKPKTICPNNLSPIKNINSNITDFNCDEE